MSNLPTRKDNPNPVIRPFDDRVVVSRPDVYPYRTIGQIAVDLGTSTLFGSGSLISDYTMLTAGHVVKDENNEFYDWDDLHFIPGRNLANEPYGRFDWQSVTAIRSGARDWALIELSTPAGHSVGYLGTRARLPLSDWIGEEGLSHVGYPRDHADEMWIDEEGGVDRIDESLQLRTDIDAAGGQSGGPLVQNFFDGSRRVIGCLIEGPNPVEDPADGETVHNAFPDRDFEEDPA